MQYNTISLCMTNYEKIANFLMKSVSNINSVAIIEDQNNLAYSTVNWDIRGEI